MDIEKYLKRIDFQGPVYIHKDVLFKLQKNHLLNIPFENLDIYYGKKINLSIDKLYQKIIIDERGGFCYELNGLFYNLLKQIGFNAKLISARVHSKNGKYSPEYDHLAIIVAIDDNEYLVDVGFGKFSLEPLRFQMTESIEDVLGQFKFDKLNIDYYRINEIIDNNLIPQYIFSDKERKFQEFEERCKFHQTSENSHFTKKKLISITTKDGRITLNDSLLKITRFGTKKEIEFNENDFETKLKQFFNIEIEKGSSY